MENLVIQTELEVISEQPLLATLTLHTMAGASAFAINADVAEGLIAMLAKFVTGQES